MARTPSSRGITTSSRSTSGRCWRASATASRPSPASATTSIPAPCSDPLMRRLANESSSAMTTRSGSFDDIHVTWVEYRHPLKRSRVSVDRCRVGCGHQLVFTDDGSTVPSALLNVNVTDPPTAPPPPLTSHVTVVPVLTMMLSGQLTVALGAPWWANCCWSSLSTVAPGTWTDPLTGAEVYWLAPFCVTFTLPVAPLLHVTVHWKVAPEWDFTPLGHFTFVTAAPDVESCCLIWASTVESSTVRTGAGVACAVVLESEPPQPAAH